MKRFTPYVFLIAMLFQLLGQLAVVTYYGFNKKIIATTRCENISKPKLNCQGKCYLKKQLKKLDDQQEPKKTVKETKTELSFCDTLIEWTAASLPVELTAFNFQYLEPEGQSHPDSIYHPPPFV